MDLKKGVIPVTELKNRTRQILEQVLKTGEPVLITQKGRSVVLIVNVETFQRNERKLHLLEEIAKGEREILEGKGIPHSRIKNEISRWECREK